MFSTAKTAAPQQEKALEVLEIPLPFPDKPPGKNNNRKITFDAICRTILFDIAEKHDVHLEHEPEYGGRAYLEKQDYILMRQKQKLELQGEAIISNNIILAEQNETLTEQHEEIAYRDELLEKKEDRLRELTVKLDDVETLMDEVADIAYEKAVDAITAEVIIETQNQDLARLDQVRKWVENPDIKRSKAERAFGLSVVDNAADFLRKGIDRIIAAVKKKFLRPEVKKQKTEEIKREARPSVIAWLQQPHPELKETPEKNQPAKKKQYDMDR